MHSRVLAAGWRLSTVDVHGSVTLTVWLCGCNLKCPFCHNWRIAERLACRELHVSAIAEEVGAARSLIDYVHLTGGEPLVQPDAVAEIFSRAREAGVRTSLNTNATLHEPLVSLLKRDLVDHVATDAKIPPDLLYGIPGSEPLWRTFLASLREMAERGIPLELRIPVANLPPEAYRGYLEEVRRALEGSRVTVIVQPLAGRPLVEPRDAAWCGKYCNPPDELLEAVAEIAKPLGRVIVKRWTPGAWSRRAA
jgi:pyruvate formate lyase activating enzyme